MAVAHDASSMYPTGTATVTSGFSWTHTPVGTPRAILVFTVESPGLVASEVTYGGVSLTAVSGGAASDTSGEAAVVKAWFLGSSIPTGGQTVAVTRPSDAPTSYAYCISATAGGDTDYAGVVLTQENATYAEKAVNDGSPGSDSVRYACGFSGLSTLPTAGASSTQIGIKDTGVNGSLLVRETNAGQGSRNVGMSAISADDAAAVHLAIIELASAAFSFSFRRAFPLPILNF